MPHPYPTGITPSFFTIDDQNLKQEISELSGQMAFVVFQHAQAKIEYLRRQVVAARVKAIKELELRATFAQLAKAPSDERVKVMVTCIPDVVQAKDAELEAECTMVMGQAIVDAYVRKKDLVIALARLANVDYDALMGTTGKGH